MQSPHHAAWGKRSAVFGEPSRALTLAVIPGRCGASNPESRDSGSGANAPSRNDSETITKQKRKTRGARASLSVKKRKRRCYAACLCMVPEADAVPRIALIERSIAPQSLVISAAARPSA